MNIQEKFSDTEYIFVNEKEPHRPMQYMAIKQKVMSMIQEKQLKDDHGELFGVLERSCSGTTMASNLQKCIWMTGR